MNETTTLWLIPLICLSGSLLSTVFILAAVANTTRLERHGRRPTPLPAARPHNPHPTIETTTTAHAQTPKPSHAQP